MYKDIKINHEATAISEALGIPDEKLEKMAVKVAEGDFDALTPREKLFFVGKALDSVIEASNENKKVERLLVFGLLLPMNKRNEFNSVLLTGNKKSKIIEWLVQNVPAATIDVLAGLGIFSSAEAFIQSKGEKND